MLKNKLFKKIYLLVNTIHVEPLTFKKAVLLFLLVFGLWFPATWLLARTKLYFGLLPDITLLAAVLIAARIMGKDELSRITVWRNIPLGVFAGVMIMFFGGEIIRSELRNFFDMLLPIPGLKYSDVFYIPHNIFFLIVSTGLFAGFTEEVFFRGIIARRFFRYYSPLKSILLSALLFAAMHLNPWQAVGAFLGGTFYGWIYWRYKSIWLCMFTHAYHNTLATLMPYPYTKIDNAQFIELWHHPLWFDIVGVVLFGFGLLTVIVLSRKGEAVAETNGGGFK